MAAAAILLGQEPTPRERAGRAASGLAREIRELLSEELAKGGFAGAVRACSESAQKKTEGYAARTGSSVRRVSLKRRNAKDEPDEFERQVLERWERELRDGKALQPHWEEGPARTGRLMQPVLIQPMCLSCHGDREEISEEVRKILTERYPDDLATGYKTGDVRGAISVQVRRRH
jgi:hypothetical protein